MFGFILTLCPFSGFLENVAPVHEKQTHHQKYFTAADSTSVGEKLCCHKIMTRKVEVKGAVLKYEFLALLF